MINKKKINLFKSIAFYFFIFFFVIIVIFFAINILIEPQIKKNLAVYSHISNNYGTRLKDFLVNLFTFNPGKIYSHELSSSQNNILLLYLNQFKWTFLISFLVFIISFILGNILGITSAYKLNKSYDVIVSVIVSFIGALPILIIAIIALTNSSFFGYPSQFLNNKLSLVSLFVPVLISSFPTLAIFFSKSRKKAFEILKSDYYLFAKSYGMNQSQLLRKTILKELLISELNLFFVIYVLLFTVTILIERIFSIPGQSLLISFAFKKGELDIIMFYFTFNFILLSIILLCNQIVIKKLDPSLQEQGIFFKKKLKRGQNA